MKKSLFLFILLICTLLVLSACSPKTEIESVEPVVPFINTIIAEGKLMPVNTLDGSFSTSGQVAEVFVQDGDQVQIGQPIARLNDSPQSQLALARAQAEVQAAEDAIKMLLKAAETNLSQTRVALFTAQTRYDEALSEYEDEASDENLAYLDLAAANLKTAEDSLTVLENGNGIDPDVLASLQTSLVTAETSLNSSLATIDDLELKANLDGILVELNLQSGQHINAGQSVITIADFSDWVIKTDNISELEVVELKIGQQAQITFDALPERVFLAEITQINQRFEEKRGDVTYTVTLLLKENDPLLRWGMTAGIQFTPNNE